ncbi:hypothetical protein JXM83_00970 [Candidatus Woesearchaeota archaeon]|nr:hypothetical protein [Candidatus Woesearchaeota archaeon]
MALFFIFLGFLFLSEHVKSNNSKTYFLALCSFLVACFFRSELSIFFGISFLIYLFLESSNFKKYFKLNMFFLVVLSLLISVLFNIYFLSDDVFLHGKFNSERGSVLSVFEIGFGLLFTNLSNASDFSFVAGNITLVFYVSIISLILILLLKLKKIKFNSVFLSIGLFWFIYVLILLSFQVESVNSVLKYNINFFLAGVFLLGFVLEFILDKLRINESGLISLLIVLFFVIGVFCISQNYFMDTNSRFITERGLEYLAVKDFHVDSSCSFLQYTSRYPLFVWYSGIKSRTFLVDDLINNNTFDDCFYLYDGLKLQMDYNEGYIDQFDLVKAKLDSSCVMLFAKEFFIDDLNSVTRLLKYDCSYRKI